MRNFFGERSKLAAMLAVLFLLVPLAGANAADSGQSKTVDGLTVYIGVVPAEIVRAQHAEGTLHDGAAEGREERHLVVAIFDAATGERVPDATVVARISPLALSGTSIALEPMSIAGTISYGGFFDAPYRDLYSITLTIRRPGQARPIVVPFQYDRRSE